MCVSILLEECQQLGFTVTEKPDGGLSVKGPRRHGALAKRVLERQADVLAAIRKEAPSFSITTGVNVSETSHLPEKNEVSLTGSGDNQDQAGEQSRSAAAEIHNRPPASIRRSLIGNGFPPMATPTPPAFILDTRQRCPACGERFILPELRWMCGELCFPCAGVGGKIGAGPRSI
jgi:hypothetical protein